MLALQGTFTFRTTFGENCYMFRTSDILHSQHVLMWALVQGRSVQCETGSSLLVYNLARPVTVKIPLWTLLIYAGILWLVGSCFFHPS